MCIAQNSYCECRKYSCKVIKIRNIVKSCPEQNFFTNSPLMFFFFFRWNIFVILMVTATIEGKDCVFVHLYTFYFVTSRGSQ